MASNKVFRLGPVDLTSALTTNLLNPPSTSGGLAAGTPQTYIILRHLRIINRSSATQTFSLWLGSSNTNDPGNEVVGAGLPVTGHSVYDWYGSMRIDASEFLVGGASADNALSLVGEGEIGIA